MSSAPFDFGDNVRVRVTAVTEAAGLAGLSGQVHGFTTPSVTGIPALGDVKNDRAYAVYITERSAAVWLAPELLALVDHGAGTVFQIKGGRKMVRTAEGKWEPVTSAAMPGEPAAAPAQKKPWWKFWG